MRSRSTRIPRGRVLVDLAASVLGLAAAVMAALAGPALAASPTPSLGPSPTAPVLATQAWLDEEPPADAAPGSSLRIGALLWDPVARSPMPAPATFVRLRPGSGDGQPVESPGTQDWRGHIVATLTVPEGGIGSIEVGIQGTACGPDGCVRSDALYDLQGVGPPKDAALPQIATVEIEPPRPAVTVGEATPVDLVLRPRVAWPGFEAPDRLVLVVRQPRGGPIDEVPAPLIDAAAGTFRASLILPAAGDYILEAATTEAASSEETFAASTVRIQGVPATATPTAAPSTPGTPSDESGLLLSGVAILVTVVAGVVIYLGVRERS
jgi:hypothetical protein